MTALAARRSFSKPRLLVGIALLLPLLLVFALVLGYPAVRVVLYSAQDVGPLRAPRFVGLENYLGMARDPLLGPAIVRSLELAAVRLLAVLLLPVLAAALWARQSPWVRVPGRLLMALAVALSSPVALHILWTALLGATLAHGPSPLRSLATTFGSLLLLQFIAFLGLGGGITALALTLAWRQERPGRAVPAVLALAAVAAVVSSQDAVSLPSVTTQAGPVIGPTYGQAIYQEAFRYFQFGKAAAELVPLLVGGTALGLLFGLVCAGLNLRLTVVPPAPGRGVSWTRLVVGVVGPLLLALPALFLLLWGAGVTIFGLGSPSLRGGPGQLGQAFQSLQPFTSALNGTLTPLVALALVQLPTSYLAGLSLGLLRPFGRWGSRVAFALLVAATFTPLPALALGLFETLGRFGAISTLPVLGVPFLVGGASLVLFYLYFNGRREAFEDAQAKGEPAVAAFFRVVFPPSLPMCGLAGATSFMLGGSSLYWPLVMINRLDLMPLSLRTMAASSITPDLRVAAGWLLLVFWGLTMLIVWGVGQAVYGERLQLDAGEEAVEAPLP